MSEQLQEKFDALFPAWPAVLATVLAVLILLFVLTKFVYRPIKKMHDDRRKYIQDNIDEAERMNHEAVIDREKANDEIIQARIQATEILATARIQAQEVKASHMAIAEKEASRLLDDAKREVAAQQTKFEVEAQEAIVEVALAAAAKVAEKAIDATTGRKIVQDFIKAK